MGATVVFGGYGTFGRIVARELAERGIRVTIAGRDGKQADAFARSLGPDHQGLAADVTSQDSCRKALEGGEVAVNCAGPFGPFTDALLQACVDQRCHYVDIADDRAFTRLVRGNGELFEERGLAAVHGCSSLPGISGALALKLLADSQVKPTRARITLFIGNNNPKGSAAIDSLVRGLGKPIQAPQGIIKGFRDREVVHLPAPFGRRAVFNFESPEYDLLPLLLEVPSVTVKVAFECRLANYAFAVLASLDANCGKRMTGFFAWLGNRAPRFGSSGGAVMVELFFPDGSVRQASLVAREHGQVMAALPCALVAADLCAGQARKAGAMTAYEYLSAPALLQQLTQRGFELSMQNEGALACGLAL